GVRLAPFGRVKPAQAYAAFREQIEALVAAGADLIVVETMSDLYEIAEAVRAAKDIGKTPVIATMTFTRDDRTLLGDSPTKVGTEMAKLGADFIGVNCSGGPAQVLRILNAMKPVAPEARFAAKPNAGWPEQVSGRIMYPATPEYFAEYALAFAEAGAKIIGGCCGTTPEHIAAMRAALDAPPGKPRERRIFFAADHEERVAPADRPTQFAEKLASGKFVIGVEMDPPRGFSTHKLLAGAHLLAEAGADVINVADSPMARMRMSAWAVCHLVQQEVKIEAVLHFPTRGRNLLRVQGDLLAAHALGVRNVFVVMGDPTSVGDYPEAMDNYDVVPSGLIKLIKQGFNAGVDHSGADIGQPTSFLAGCAVNLSAPDMDKEIRALRKKIVAGADFALTQPVYDIAPMRELIRRYEARHGLLTLPLLVGVLPLYSARHANFLHNEVPGISIPELLRQRIAGAENGAEEGVRIAQELLAELQDVPAVRGAYLMPPFGRYDLAAEIIERVRGKVASSVTG
ncbi:MAG TPA: bifunctional homocysteine S-methyltransferase/methylenetetrahydrofolate reductase, partial [Anaerolineales bacterium]|nr:bifunctional homocysteine S-methyltransferase/methylenetetrahydrofolate reductase [Anaerolineales bacterium]